MKLYRVLAGLVVVSLGLSACLGVAPTPARPPLKVGWSLWGGWYPILIAQQKEIGRAHV